MVGDAAYVEVPTAGHADRGAWYMVGLLSWFRFVSYIARFLPSLLTPAIKADLHLTDFAIGLLLGPRSPSLRRRWVCP